MSACIHCNDQIIHEPILDEFGNMFCCNGCKQVYALIGNEDGLEFYYTLLKAEKKYAPSAKEKKSPLIDRLSDEHWEISIGEFAGNLHSVSLFSSEIHCSACGWLLETVLKKEFPGVQIHVDFFRGILEVSYDNFRYRLRDILLFCQSFGYTFELMTGSGVQLTTMNRSLLIRLAISGAIFANVMIFSLGIYFGMFSGIDQKWVTLFSWYSLALSIPVITYCAFPFYQKAFEGIRRKVLHMDLPVAIGVLCTFVVSTYLTVTGYHGYFDSVSGLVFFLLIGRWGIQKFERSIVLDNRWFEGLKNDLVKRVTENGIEDVPIEQVQGGDQLVVFPNEYIPMDGTLQTPLTWVDKSLLTGESELGKIVKGALLFAGYKNLKEKIVLTVTNPESKDRIHQLKKQFDALIQEKNRNRDAVEKIVPWFIAAVLAFSGVTFLTHYSSGFENALLYAASVLVVSCPCALALARPLTYGLALKRLSSIGIFTKKHDSLDAINEISTVLFDKTGTLTMTERTIKSWKWGEAVSEIDRDGYYALMYAAVSQSFHPVSLSIKKSIEEYEHASLRVQNMKFTEIVGVGLHISARVVDKEHEMFLVSAKVISSQFDARSLTHPDHQKAIELFQNKYWERSSEAETLVFVDGKLVAEINFQDTIKPGVIDIVNYLNDRSIQTVLVSGDMNHQVTEFAENVPFTQSYGEQSPEDKHALLVEYQKHGAVAAVGDGFNDSLFVASADVGVVVKGGADYLGEGADVLLISPDFNRFSNLIHIAKRTRVSVRRCYTISILYNLFAISLALTGYISPLWAAALMPLSSLSIALVALFTVRYHD